MIIRMIGIVAVLACQFSWSAGYRVSLQGVKQLGMGHTGVALGTSAEALFFNPAGLALLDEGVHVSAGGFLLHSESVYQNLDTNAQARTESPLATPVDLYAAYQSDHGLSYGLGIYTPYGSSVIWPRDWAGSHLINTISMRAIMVQPSVALTVDDWVSVGAGVTYVNGAVEFDRNLNTSMQDTQGQRSRVVLSEEGIDAWGYNLGLLLQPLDWLSIGVDYRGRIDLEVKQGKANFSHVPASLTNYFSDTTFAANLPLPAELTLGVALHLTPDVLLALDWNYTFWSAYKSLDIDFGNNLNDSINPRNYQDTPT